LLVWYLYRRPPQTAAQVCKVAGVVMAVITLFAPATRIGYLLYPINFFVWAHLFSDRERGELPEPDLVVQPPAEADTVNVATAATATTSPTTVA
jgi:hypothetical protein